MIGADAILVAREVRQKNDSDDSEAIADEWNDNTGDEEQRDLVPLAKHHVGEKNAQCDSCDEEAQSGAGLSDFEAAVRQFDERSFGGMRYADNIQTHVDEDRRKALHRCDQILTRRNQKEEIQGRKPNLPIDARAKRRDDRDLNE